MTVAVSTDPEGMLGTVEASADQWDHALELARAATDLTVPSQPRAVLVAGMGGSGIAADVARVLSDVQGTCPVVPVKDYRLPVWAGPDTPMVAVSYSGNTEETLAAVDDGLSRGCPLVVVTSGGRLADVAADRDAPTVTVPGGRQPRASLAYLTVPALVALDRGGVLPGITADLAAVPDHLRDVRQGWAGRPDQVADGLRDRIPVFVGGRGVGALVAQRAKCQVNENAERPAFANELPELDHNEVVGWGGGPDAPFGVVELRDAGEHDRVARRFAVTREVTADVLDVVDAVTLSGRSTVERIAAGVLFVDLVSVTLALRGGVDPTPVARIDTLKQLLSEGRP